MDILYVEDNDLLREMVSALMVESAGRRVTCCATAEEALELDAQRRFDVVMTDVSLPGRSGLELARTLLERAPTRWIVLCTGYDLGDHAALLGPQVRSLMKPFDFEALEALLDDIQEAGHDQTEV